MHIATKHRIKIAVLPIVFFLMIYWHETNGEISAIVLVLAIPVLYIYVIYMMASVGQCNKCKRSPLDSNEANAMNPSTYMLIFGKCPCCKK